MKQVTREARLSLNVPMEGGNFGQVRPLLATELVDALNRLAPTLPPDARLVPNLQPQPTWAMSEAYLVFSWEEELPSPVEIS